MTKKQKLDTIFNHTFKHAKKLARNFYFKQWAKNPPRCPAFDGEEINVGREGWEHVVEGKYRSKMDVLGRICCLERAKYLLEKSTAYQDYEKREQDNAEYWAFEGIVDGIKIKVVIRAIQKGQKHFYSVIRKGTIVVQSIEKEQSPA